MANQQAYHAYAQNKGTLVPGQSISVNKFTVQVERYLSQGGFAHVYLVRTAAPVYNTTHHVLKRIAVANDAMLTEVKKEVDIMRLLKGHPNIVYLIDAAWHKMPNGTYEVFILMEFCKGGGIIDMMNRRLRERLTEAEILQIFVDVCEGVACMHNSRPALLHRDLKVENILQSTPTSFKLCDFGSATTVARPPTTTQEIRALEADLNRHTTLQYRAPEMVDPYSRKPVDEKSDVWALGVLLYKLCYYTTPFEEHGPLAILNVQYRIPPYPVYSLQMNQLIGSMLQEHGISRPSVFELLAHVHKLRGTESRFHYTIPVPQPLSPRHQTQQSRPPPLNHTEKDLSPSTHLVTSHASRPTSSASLSNGHDVQKREKLIETMPLRRGRPTASKDQSSSSSRQESPQKNPISKTDISEKAKNWLGDFVPDANEAWKTTTINPPQKVELDDAWNVGGKKIMNRGIKESQQGFGDDFAEKLWDTFTTKEVPSGAVPNADGPTKGSIVSSAATRPITAGAPLSSSKDRDAFAGLGLSTSSDKSAPTLGEARKLRTGLAAMSGRYDHGRASSSRLTPSPRQTHLSTEPQSQPQLQPHALSPPLNNSSGSSTPFSPKPDVKAMKPNPSIQSDGLPVESRFPSLEELDATFTSTPGHAHDRNAKKLDASPLHRRNSNLGRPGPGTNKLLKPVVHSYASLSHEGTRSEQVTGIAMREPRGSNSGHSGGRDREGKDALKKNENQTSNEPHPEETNTPSRPALTRKHRSSITMKHIPRLGTEGDSPDSQTLAPPSPRPSSRRQKDWLTGEDDDHGIFSPSKSTPVPPGETPVLRDSPSKRASFIQKSALPIQDAVVAQHDHTPARSQTPLLSPEPPATISPTLSRFTRTFPPIHTTDQEDGIGALSGKSNSVATYASERRREVESSSSADEGPEDAAGLIPISTQRQEDSKRIKRKGRQSSVHDLVDLWGGGLGPKEKETHSMRPPGVVNEAPPNLHGVRSLVPPLGSARSNPNPRSASPPPFSPPNGTTPGRHGPGRDEMLSNSPTPSPAPSRPRPQSLFIFPSKSNDGSSIPSASLLPPEIAAQRSNSRRTSISDIVQRYEGIKLKPKSAGLGPPSPSRPIGKIGSSAPEDGRYTKTQETEISKAQSGLPTPADFSHRHSSRSPTDVNQVTANSSFLQHETRHNESAASISRPRRPSLRPEMSKSSFPSSHRSTEESLPHSDGGSSSPERPYQGVGKLIDQWQRKTAEANPPRPAVGSKRGGFVNKRTEFVHRGQ